MVFPNRRLRPTPYTRRLDEAGITYYTVYNHMLLPTIIQSLEEDYRHLKQYAQIWDVSAERQVEIVGPDARKLATMLSARDLTNAVPGRCYYAPITDGQGGMINDPIALCLAEDRFWFSIADSDLGLWAAGLAHGLELNVQVFEPDVSPLAVQGPMAEDLMADVFGPEIRDVKFFRFGHFEFMGRQLVIARSGWSKQGGFEIYLDDGTLGEALWDAIVEKGADYNLRPGCPNLIERIEGGLLSYGNDMTRSETPLEVGLDRYCQLDKGHRFIGRDALLRQRDQGITRKIVGVKVQGSDLSPVMHPVHYNMLSRSVGMVTSSVYSPDVGDNIGFAMVNIEEAETGTTTSVSTAEGRRDALVCDMPFL
jgi:dimethylsulfoniopropionate demethylase